MISFQDLHHFPHGLLPMLLFYENIGLNSAGMCKYLKNQEDEFYMTDFVTGSPACIIKSLIIR